jgi:hypothetical protein
MATDFSLLRIVHMVYEDRPASLVGCGILPCRQSGWSVILLAHLQTQKFYKELSCIASVCMCRVGMERDNLNFAFLQSLIKHVGDKFCVRGHHVRQGAEVKCWAVC